MNKKDLLEKCEQDGLALTFDDVRLRTGYSEVMPDNILTITKFSRNVDLKIPIVSAAMDTVTESKMAIELAKLGGIGVIHKNMTADEQVKQVAKVKHHLNGLILKPVCVFEDQSIDEIEKMLKDKDYSFQSLPVISRLGKLVGILSGNDFEFCSDKSLRAIELMSDNVLVAKEGTGLQEAYEIMVREKKKALPLVNDDEEVIGLYVFSDVKRIVTGSAESYNTDFNGRLRVAAAIGVGEDAMQRAKLLNEEGVDVFVIGTAHGDSKPVIDTLREIKKLYPGIDVVVGNVSVGESVRRLAEEGADGILVGQGPGSICTTRIIAGIGRPQVSAIYDCVKVADQYGIPVCADGGLKLSGDITIAIGAGASCVMLGNMLAGTKEAPGDVIFLQGRPWKSYRGMGSLAAMEKNKGSRERYSQVKTGKNDLIAEGVEGNIPFKGNLRDVVFQYVGGLKRGMGYVGAANIKELRDKGEFDRITGSGLVESHPHDINVTKDSSSFSIDI